MSWIFTVALGIGIGYFAFQSLKRNNEEKQNEEFESAETETAEAAKTTRAAGVKRICKSATDKKLAGVCGGIAEYLKVDPSIVRLVTILLMFGWGSGILAYIVCALVLPEE